MAGKEMVPFGAALVGDILSTLQLPGGGLLGKVGDKYIERKQKEAADIFIEEIAKGSPEPISFTDSETDPLIEIIYRFSKAVSDGAARENLRLLAQVIAGLKRNKALEPDKFRKWANILEQLTRDELMVVGKAIAIMRRIDRAGPNVPNDFWQTLKSELEVSRYPANEVDSLCTSVSRTGLLVPVSAWGGTIYMSTPWLDELGTLADVEGVVSPN